MTTTGRYQNRSLSNTVLDYFLANEGRSIGIDELVRELNIPSKPVRSGISYLRLQKGYPIVIEMMGHRWRYDTAHKVNPPQHQKVAPSRLLYEELATTRTGVILVQSEAGDVYKLVEL